VRRPALLTVLWALFAAAAIGVGFGAAGLVGNPFTDTVGDTLAGQQTTSSIGSAPGSSPSSSTITRVTRGGQVFASCVGGLVSIGASPARDWQLDRIDQGRLTTAGLEFTRSGKDGKVEVSVHCVAGIPRFTLGDGAAGAGESPTATETGDDHGGRSPGGGGSDDGGSSGSGGSSPSSGSSGSDGGSGGSRGRG
jgi:hypothetical protein